MGCLRPGAVLAIDESAPFFLFDGLREACPELAFVNGAKISAQLRMHKSAAELRLIQRAMDMTLEVHKAAARILRPGISTAEVEDFIDKAHRAVGASGSYFCIVLFGEDSAYPHGSSRPRRWSRVTLC